MSINVVSDLPQELQLALNRAQETNLRQLTPLYNRMEEFAENDVVSLLAAIGQVPEARELFDVAITEMQEVPRPVANRVELLIIGGGLHATIFASTYYRLTGVKPLVIEERDRTGGIFDLAERE